MCDCPDKPCCGCGDDRYDPEAEMERFLEARDAGDMGGDIEMEEDTDDEDNMTDAEADADALADAGMGYDEQYEHETPLGEFYGGE
jgi:hypothetical protein